MTVSDAKSNIFTHLYCYNLYNNPPTPVSYDMFNPSTHSKSFYNGSETKLNSSDKAWID